MISQSSLIDYVDFPDPNEFADEDGIVAVGGDLSPEFLISAYRQGVFPWYNLGEPIMWWSPEPRCILEIEKLHISSSMKRFLRKKKYKIRVDTNFEGVVIGCQEAKRKNETGTWISSEIIEGYNALFNLGIGHSFEVYNFEDKLVGGLYGLSIGKAFYGESMFASETNCSKLAFIFVAQLLDYYGFQLFDCQVENPHLTSLGASIVSRKSFLEINKNSISFDSQIGPWTRIGEDFEKVFWERF